jgi:hypothetical protein
MYENIHIILIYPDQILTDMFMHTYVCTVWGSNPNNVFVSRKPYAPAVSTLIG